MDRPIQLVICTAEDCRRSKGYGAVLALARVTPGTCAAGCQGICHGPVVGVRRGRGAIRWYQRVRGKRRRALEKIIATGSGRKALKGVEVRSKRGRVRRPHQVRALVE